MKTLSDEELFQLLVLVDINRCSGFPIADLDFAINVIQENIYPIMIERNKSETFESLQQRSQDVWDEKSISEAQNECHDLFVAIDPDYESWGYGSALNSNHGKTAATTGTATSYYIGSAPDARLDRALRIMVNEMTPSTLGGVIGFADRCVVMDEYISEALRYIPTYAHDALVNFGISPESPEIREMIAQMRNSDDPAINMIIQQPCNEMASRLTNLLYQ